MKRPLRETLDDGEIAHGDRRMPRSLLEAIEAPAPPPPIPKPTSIREALAAIEIDPLPPNGEALSKLVLVALRELEAYAHAAAIDRFVEAYYDLGLHTPSGYTRRNCERALERTMRPMKARR